MRQVDGHWVSDEPPRDYQKAWGEFWSAVAPELARQAIEDAKPSQDAVA